MYLRGIWRQKPVALKSFFKLDHESLTLIEVTFIFWKMFIYHYLFFFLFYLYLYFLRVREMVQSQRISVSVSIKMKYLIKIDFTKSFQSLT